MPIIGGKLNLDKINFLDSFLYDKPTRLFNPRALLQALRTPLYNSTLSRLQLTYNNLHEYITLRKLNPINHVYLYIRTQIISYIQKQQHSKNAPYQHHQQ